MTGASGGLGQALLRAFLAVPDTEVHGLCRSAQAVGLRDDRLRLHELDLRDEDAAAALRIPGPIDVLVHSAAIGRNMTFAEASVADWREFFEVNVFAVVGLTRVLSRDLSPTGDIVFVNSGLGLRASPASVPYSASKAALRSLAEAMRAEFNDRGTRVTTVYPGQIATDMLRANVHAMGRPWEPERYVQPDDLARCVVSIVRSGRSLQLTDVAVRPAAEVW